MQNYCHKNVRYLRSDGRNRFSSPKLGGNTFYRTEKSLKMTFVDEIEVSI